MFSTLKIDFRLDQFCHTDIVFMHFTRPPRGAWTKTLLASHDLEDCRFCFCCLRAFENVQTIPADCGAAKSIVAVGTGNYRPGRATVPVGRDMS